MRLSLFWPLFGWLTFWWVGNFDGALTLKRSIDKASGIPGCAIAKFETGCHLCFCASDGFPCFPERNTPAALRDANWQKTNGGRHFLVGARVDFGGWNVIPNDVLLPRAVLSQQRALPHSPHPRSRTASMVAAIALALSIFGAIHELNGQKHEHQQMLEMMRQHDAQQEPTSGFDSK